MADIKEKFEFDVAEGFFEWLTDNGGPRCVFSGRAGQAPDLVYVAATGEEIQIEITGTYYDGSHAKFLWDDLRGVTNPSSGWHGVGNPDKKLANDLSKRLHEKCKKRYGPTTILLIQIPPGLTSAEDLAKLLFAQTLPPVVSFAGVYVVGRFPITSKSSGGYRVLTIKEYWPLPSA